ncbi:MAG: hypothetical protein AB8B55_18750 [Mariniblastus sp.]
MPERDEVIPNELATFQLRNFQLWHLFVLMFNVSCFILFVRLSWTVGRESYTSLEFILGTLGAIGFPIGMGMLNRGSFFTMVFSFGFSVVVSIVTYSWSQAGL